MVVDMEKSITVVGGDLRIVKLIEMLDSDGYKVYTYGLEMSEELLQMDVEMCSTIEETVSYSKVVVGPIPLSSDRKNVSTPFSKVKLPLEDLLKVLKDKKLIAGNILEFFKEQLEKEEISYIDLIKREEFSVLNAIATAEGTIQIAMEETQRTIHGTKTLIMGFGMSQIMVGSLEKMDMIVGMVTGVVGLLICVLNYPIYSYLKSNKN
jgi:dipicolinate synthase subunit A